MESLHPSLDLAGVDWSNLPNTHRVTGDTFALITVDVGGVTLKEFIGKAGVRYSFREDDAGNSYFEWTTTLKDLKQNVDLVVYDTANNCFYTGNGIRQLLSLPDRGGAFWKAGERQDITNFSPINIRGRDQFPIFISSTSVARRVKTGDKVLYRLVPLSS